MPEMRPHNAVQNAAQDIPGLDTLLVEIAGGSRNAFESLYRATSSKLFSVCLRVIPDRAEAEDVLQEVFTTIWHKAHQFDPGRASPISWLAMIARNKAIDRIRSQPARAARCRRSNSPTTSPTAARRRCSPQCPPTSANVWKPAWTSSMRAANR